MGEPMVVGGPTEEWENRFCDKCKIMAWALMGYYQGIYLSDNEPNVCPEHLTKEARSYYRLTGRVKGLS